MKKFGFNMNKDEKTRGARKIMVLAAFAVVAAGIAIGAVSMLSGDDPVKFSQVGDEEMPETITADIIPEYRTLERALACAVDNDIYVIVTRGEKPTSGFNVSIDLSLIHI